jgi:hypothetical protein
LPLVWASPRLRRRTRRAIRHGAAAVCELAVGGVVGCASATASHEALVSDRPDFTESTSTVRPGGVQAEGGYTFSRVADERSSAAGELLVRIGVTRRAELRLEPGSYEWVTSSDGRQTGRDDAEVGVKLRVHKAADERPSPVPAVSVVLATSVPTGSREFREGRLQPEAKLATEWTLAPHVSLATNLDVARLLRDGRRYTELAASASLGVDLSPRMGAFAEAFGFAPEISGEKHTAYLDTGLTAMLTADLQIDVRGGVGLNGMGPDYFVGAGLVRRW